MSLVNYIGSYDNLTQVWEAFPEGGKDGDYLYVDDVLLHWDRFSLNWVEPSQDDIEGVEIVKSEDSSLYASMPVVQASEEDIIKDSPYFINCLGVFESLQQLWDKYPEGGKEGDYIYIGQEFRYWNKFSRSWVIGVVPDSSQIKPIEVAYTEGVVSYSDNYINYLGSFESIEQAWKVYPNGGRDGDFILINGEQLRWNKYISNWGEVDMSDVTPARPVAAVWGDLHIHNDLVVGEALIASIFERLVTELQLSKLTPKRIASEELMQDMIDNGLVEEGQIYYVPEEQ